MPISLEECAARVSQEIDRYKFGRGPSYWCRDHALGWERTLQTSFWGGDTFGAARSVAEKWGFLGSLLRGNVYCVTNVDALQYMREFLEPLNPGYRETYHLLGHQGGPDLYTMLTGFNGLVPATISEAGRVIGYSIGRQNLHLTTRSPENGTFPAIELDTLHIDVPRLIEELFRSLLRFAEYLDQNSDVSRDLHSHTPRQRWLRALWSKYCPIGLEENLTEEWMNLGVAHYGIPSLATGSV